MAAMLTCRSCAHKGSCDIRAAILGAIKGLGVSSLKHRCASHEAPYRTGQAIWAFVMDAPWSEYEEGPGEPIRAWFPGHFIEVSTRGNTRGLVTIESGVQPREQPPEKWNDSGFYPGHKKGICKLVWSRIEPRDGPDAPLCPQCGEIKRLMEPNECAGYGIVDGFKCPLKAKAA